VASKKGAVGLDLFTASFRRWACLLDDRTVAA